MYDPPHQTARVAIFAADLEAGRITEEQFRLSLEEMEVPGEMIERFLAERADRPRTPMDPFMEQLLPIIESIQARMSHQSAAMELTRLAATTNKPIAEIVALYRESLALLDPEQSGGEE